MHFVNMRRARDSQNGRTVVVSHPLERESQEWSVMPGSGQRWVEGVEGLPNVAGGWGADA